MTHRPDIDETLRQLGLTSSMAADLTGVTARNIRRWRNASGDAPVREFLGMPERQGPPDFLRELLTILVERPGALDALRDEYRPDHPDAGPRDMNETKRRLRWLKARFPD